MIRSGAYLALRRPGSLLILALLACGGSAVDREETARGDGDAPPEARAELGGSGRTNRLIKEKSPYLLQHAHNPVDWYPWGDEALARARREDRPIFLSIGYSTCHWCHVMERESFENDEIAALLNEYFVCIKVDREERPDLDALYMAAVQGMTGRGGWPMTVCLTPDLEPFFAGTYLPPDERMGRPGMRQIVPRLGMAWRDERERVVAYASQVAEALRLQAAAATGDGAPGSASAVPGSIADEPAGAPPVAGRPGALGAQVMAAAFQRLATRYDGETGGFSPAPKFPTPHLLSFLLRHARRAGDPGAVEMVKRTLDHMAMGGIHDQIGGGFHRYSTDAIWLVPHFEKMLYDQAGLAIAYIEAWLVTGNAVYATVARDILDYVLAYMTDAGGGFYSAEDADSEGEEGTFYVWSSAGIDDVLGPGRGSVFRRAYGVSEAGNWEGTNVLHAVDLETLESPELASDRRRLLEARDRRPRPHLDDKIVTGWNGYMIEALALAGAALDEPRYLDAARAAAGFVEANLWRDGRLLRHYRQGPAPIGGFLDDYAFLGRGLLGLYEATFEPDYLERAITVGRELLRLFARPDGALPFTASDAEKLIAPVIEAHDGALPSAASVAAGFLLRLGHLTANPELEESGWRALEAFSTSIERSPDGHLGMLAALDFALGPATELVVAGDPEDAEVRRMCGVIRGRYLPNAVSILRRPGDDVIARLVPYTDTQIAIDGMATAYVCRDYACRLPVQDADALVRLLDGIARGE